MQIGNFEDGAWLMRRVSSSSLDKAKPRTQKFIDLIQQLSTFLRPAADKQDYANVKPYCRELYRASPANALALGLRHR